MTKDMRVSFLFILVFSLFETVAGVKKNPNILLILADDVGQGDLPPYFNSSAVTMPNIEKLVSKGLTFTDMHSTPLCAPSRYVLLSGNYQHRGRKVKGTWTINTQHNNFKGKQKSIAEALRDGADYNTGFFGKWHLGGKIQPSGVVDKNRHISSPYHDWNFPIEEGPQDVGFVSSYFTPQGIQDAPYAFFRDGFLDMELGTEKYWKKGYHNMQHGVSIIRNEGEGSSDWDSTAYNMILVNETEKFIDDHINDRPSDPFFAYVATGSVHLPHSPPDHYLDGTPIAGHYNSTYLNMLLELDKVVGSLVELIESRHLEEETIIIFTSDNGGINPAHTQGASELGHSSSGPLRGMKGWIYEGGHRVPMIWRQDTVVPSGEKRNHFLGLNDIYATLCEIAGVELPSKSAKDSVSFADYLLSESHIGKLRNILGLWDYKGKAIEAAALRKGDYKFVQKFLEPAVEFYDLGKDISETIDLASNATYSSLVSDMAHMLAKIGPCPPDTTDRFYLKVGSTEKRVRCRWIARRKKKRCKLAKTLKRICPFTCGRHSKICEGIKQETLI